MQKGMTDLSAALADAAAMPWSERLSYDTVYRMLEATAKANAQRPALSFQIKSGEKDKAETLNWAGLFGRVTQAANMFRRMGVHEDDVVALLLPNCNEAVIAHLGAMTAGKVAPINPTLAPEQISALLRETGAKIVVTIKPFPKTEVPDTVAAAVAQAPNVETVLEVDLKRYLTPPLSWIVPLIRPKRAVTHGAEIRDFNAEIETEEPVLYFPENTDRTRNAALFHTGGTTGMPKIVQQNQDGLLYNGWVADHVLCSADDVMICPLPMFHVFGANVILLASVASGAHVVMPTPAGYRGDGVMDNFWKLVERWGVTFMVMVPTAASALMQRPINADVSSLKSAFCGSAALPQELFKRFEEATGVRILEGYGMTEATCLVSGNPFLGDRKIGSVGLPFPYTDVRILHSDEAGTVMKECATGEVGEICVSNPGVSVGFTYTQPSKNVGLYADQKWLRTGDLGKRDEDGYVYITGRAKDLIIRGGHNIDPAVIEEALAAHPAIAFAGAIGQPDAHAGEIPCVYVELVEDAEVTEAELMAFCETNVPERAAVPKFLEIMDELPKTAVGKIFKPDLRKSAITRIYSKALADADLPVVVSEVIEDKQRGLVARLVKAGDVEDAAVTAVLGGFIRPWEWAAPEADAP